MAFRLGISRAFLSHIEVRLIEEQLTRTFTAHRGKPSARLPPAACGGHPQQGPAAACRPPPAHLERLQPHEARLALLVLEDEEGPPILIKRQRPHGRHGCGGSQRPPTAPNGHPSTSRARPARRAVTQRARPPAAPRLRKGPPRDVFRGGNLCGARGGAFWKRPGAPGAARRSRPRPPARRGGAGECD